MTVDILAAPGVRHGFFTRAGGVSAGDFASLNCGYGSGDDADRVSENRRRVRAAILDDSGSLVTAYQKHTADALIVREAWSPEHAPVGDALVTDRPGVALSILTADCAPVLLADSGAGVIGAAHAGWRGAFDGVIESTLTRMVELGARIDRIAAAVGPCIGKDSYEVGPEFKARFVAADATDADLFAPSRREGHAMFDLTAYIERRLARAGVARVGRSGGDTCADGELFFSYRRMVLTGERAYGRGISAIALAP